MAKNKKRFVADKNKREVEEEEESDDDSEGFDEHDDFDISQAFSDKYSEKKTNNHGSAADGTSVGHESEDGDFDDDDEEEEDDEFDEHDGFDISQAIASNNHAATKRKNNSQEKAVPPAKKSKTKKNAFVKPPTAEEFIILRETENLFQSNLFRLQMEEMLKELKPKPKHEQKMKKWVDDFSSFLSGLDDSKEFKLWDHKWLTSNNIKFPIDSSNIMKGEGLFKFVKPIKVLSLGSFSSRTVVGKHFTLDLAVVMPKVVFKKSDKLNHIYLVKRALYLCYIATMIQKSGLVESGNEVKFWSKTADPLKPSLVFRPAGKISEFVEIILTALPQEGTFKPTQFTPEKCNITVSNDDGSATPYYNSCILEDIIAEKNEMFKLATCQEYECFSDAMILLGVWLRLRGLSDGYGSINRHVIMMYATYLFKSKLLNKQMSSYQLLRNIWLNLSKSKWLEIGDSLVQDVTEDVPTIDLFHQYSSVVLVDSTGFHNFTFRVHKTTYIRVKREAALAIDYLNNPDVNSFQYLFMSKVNFIQGNDNIVCFPDFEVIKRTVELFVDPKKKQNYSNHTLPLFYDLLYDALGPGLSSRILYFSINLVESSKWSIDSGPTCVNYEGDLMIGWILNPQTAFSVIDKGPEANSLQAIEFRNYWGDKSDLRRFKDGSVCESVIWEENSAPLLVRRAVVRHIVNYILRKKLKLDMNVFNFLMPDFTKSVLMNRRFPGLYPEETGSDIHSSFESLSQELRDLKDLPLTLVSVECISPVYRFTEVCPPVQEWLYFKKEVGSVLDENAISSDSMQCPPYVQPIDLAIQLETSRKWPEDINAGKRLVAAFNAAIAQSLATKCNLKTQFNTNYVTVLKNGFVFRLHLGYSKEIGLLKQQLTSDGMLKYRDTKESILLEKKFVNLPKLSGFLFGLSQLYPSYGASTVLAKRWISSQLFSESHFPSILIELLVARLFVTPYPYTTLSQPLPVFLRFLQMLASTDWLVEPIIINLNGQLSRVQIIEIEQYFNENRQSLPPMFIATPFDLTGSLWTKDAPTIPTLVRLAKLAAKTLNILNVLLTTGDSESEMLSVFKPSMSIFDIIIKLNPGVVTRRAESLMRSIPNKWKLPKKTVTTENLPVVGFDPVQSYLKDLEANFSDYALFFHDIYGGDEIGVLLKPTFLEDVEFKTSHCGPRTPVDIKGNALLIHNKEALIDGFKIFGAGLVMDVIVK